MTSTTNTAAGSDGASAGPSNPKKTRTDTSISTGCRSSFSGLLYKLYSQMTTDIVKEMKLILRAYQIGAADVEKCTSGEDILALMMERNLLQFNRTHDLRTILRDINRIALLKIVENYAKTCPDVPAVPTDSHVSDDLFTMQRELQFWYKHVLSKLHPIPWCDWIEKDLDHVFTNLELVKGQKHHPFKGRCSDSAVIVREFLRFSQETTRYFVEGLAGIGKSTLCRHLVYTWATNEHQIYGCQFDLVLILEARTLTNDLMDSIFCQLFPRDFSLKKSAISKCIQKHQEKCLIIIDGVDELSNNGKTCVMDILHGRIFRRVNLLLAGRPETAEAYIKHINTHLRVTGFTWENALSYIKKYFETSKHKVQNKLIRMIESDSQLSDLVSTPFTTLQLCFLAEQSKGNIPKNRGKILEEVLRTSAKNYLIKQKVKEVDPENLIAAAEHLAYAGVKSELLIYEESNLESYCIKGMGEHLLKSGLLNRDFILSRQMYTTGYCYFPHRSIQEFLCVQYLTKLSAQELKEIFKQNRHNAHMQTWNVCEQLLEVFREDGPKFAEAIVYFSSLKSAFLCQFVGTAVSNITNMNTLSLVADKMGKYGKVNRALLYTVSSGETFYHLLQHMVLKHVVVIEDFQHISYVRSWFSMRLAYNLVPGFAHNYSFRWSTKGGQLPYLSNFGFEYSTPVFVMRNVHSNQNKSLQFRGLTLPCVNCFNINAAVSLLDQGVRVNLLCVCVFPGKINLRDMERLTNRLKSVDTPMVMYLIVFVHREEDYSYLRMLQILTKYDFDNVKLCYRTFPWVCSNSRQNTDRCFAYMFRNFFHCQYFDKYCPY